MYLGDVVFEVFLGYEGRRVGGYLRLAFRITVLVGDKLGILELVGGFWSY